MHKNRIWDPIPAREEDENHSFTTGAGTSYVSSNLCIIMFVITWVLVFGIGTFSAVTWFGYHNPDIDDINAKISSLEVNANSTAAYSMGYCSFSGPSTFFGQLTFNPAGAFSVALHATTAASITGAIHLKKSAVDATPAPAGAILTFYVVPVPAPVIAPVTPQTYSVLSAVTPVPAGLGADILALDGAYSIEIAGNPSLGPLRCHST